MPTALAVPPAIDDAVRIAALAHTADRLTIRWSDGRESPYPAIWLADNRPDRRDRPDGQRLFDAIDLPDGIVLRGVTLGADGAVEVDLAGFDTPARFETAWLRAHALDPTSRAERRRRPVLWDSSLALPTGDYTAVAGDDDARAKWLRQVHDHGFALLRGVPAEPGMVCKVVELFGFVRETNYGRLFDVVAVDKPQNLAFSALSLGNHTDNPYRDPVPQMQLLHCLEAASEGGESVVVDGFAAADRLRREAPDAFALLTRRAVPFRYVEAGKVDLRAKAPLIELDADGDVAAVRYNNRSIAPFDLDPDEVEAFYDAYRRFGRLLHDPNLTVGFRLAPGDLFIVDNRRVLHGRRGFSAGRRWLQGCYADKDGLTSTLFSLESSR
ncbi:2-trimethylaminoethylphosphonate dioxygenase [Inquilinus sp. CA228]|uniref:2-trimethylaminoethylphosphonate dioxygenase n=1 Tax=Inquilinus sp. CA228 TaxID=3455609 RepID=UPI003F8D0E61